MAAGKSRPPPLPDAWGPRWATPRRVVGGVLFLAVLGAGWLWANDPELGRGFLPPCVWFVATGTYCPGCGITRALHDLLHGRMLAALDHNALGLLVLTITAGVLVKPCWVALRENTWKSPVLPQPTARWLLIGGIAWAVLRNLPWAPFTILAP
jgi:hypothetical protein